MSGISKREQVKKAYPGDGWAARVNKMTENQVVAIFLRLKREGKV